MGFDDEPMRPVMRDDTVAKKNPKIRIRTDVSRFPWVGRLGATAMKMASASEPPSTTIIGISRSVRACAPLAAPLAAKSRKLPRADATIVGIVRASVIRPAARTPPAPIYRMYALQS